MGDLDGDGDLDVFSVRRGANRVFLNQGGWQRGTPGTFEPTEQMLLSKVGHPNNPIVKLADLDGDGDVDAFTPNSIWFNLTGDADAAAGEFGEHQQLVGAPISAVATLADFDGDGDIDAVDAPRAGGLFLNDGDGVFTASGDFSYVGGLPKSVAAGDLDGDGDVDLYLATLREDRIALNEPEPFFEFHSDGVYEIVDGNGPQASRRFCVSSDPQDRQRCPHSPGSGGETEHSSIVRFNIVVDADKDGVSDEWELETIGDLSQDGTSGQ